MPDQPIPLAELQLSNSAGELNLFIHFSATPVRKGTALLK
ncbi:MAG: hypothetical protein RL571_2290 [Pseudomonadota bacterium]|jgi:hypothetical protein